MNEEKQRRLEQSGWKVGAVAEFLELTPEETILLDSTLAADNALIHGSQLLTNQASWPWTSDGGA